MSDLLLRAASRQKEEQPDTSFSFSEEDKTKIREELLAARKTDSKTKEQLEVEKTAWSSEDSLAAAQRFFSSAALGWGDEMGLWTAAVINAMPVVGTYAQYGLETTVSEQYDKLKEEYDAKQEAFKQRQAGAAMAADIAGSIASPVNLLKTPALAARAVAPTTRTGKAVEAVRQATPTAARVAAESAVYGAGEAKQGERLEGAKTGAGMGLAGYGVLRGGMGLGGKTVSAFTRRNVEGDLIDDAGDFVPLTLAATKPGIVEGTIHTFYRDIIGPAFGGKGVIKTQEEKIIGKAKDYYKAQKAISKDMDEGLKIKIQENQNKLNDAVEAFKDQKKELEKVSKNKTAPLEEKLQTLKFGKPEEITERAAADVRKALDARRFDFRNQAFSSAMPAEATINEIQKVLAVENIGQRVKALDELWKRRGYSMIKGKKIRVKKDEFTKKLSDAIVNDSVFKVLLPDITSFKNNVLSSIRSIEKFKDKNRRIDGDVLSTIRARLGTFAASAGDPQVRKAYYMAQGKIDDIIENQLTDAQKVAFKQEAQNWKSTVILRDAIENTRNDPTKRSIFDESDWIKAASDNNTLDKRYGTGPLVKDAHVLEANLMAYEKSVAKRSANLAKAKAFEVEKTIKNHNLQLEKDVASLDKKISSAKARLRNNPQLSQDIAKDTLLKKQKEAEVESLKSQLDTLKELRSSKNPSWFHTLAASGILAGFMTGGFIGAGGGLATAVVGASALATPTAQKLIAGQQPWQMATQRLLQADATGRTADILARSIGRTGLLTGGQQ